MSKKYWWILILTFGVFIVYLGTLKKDVLPEAAEQGIEKQPSVVAHGVNDEDEDVVPVHPPASEKLDSEEAANALESLTAQFENASSQEERDRLYEELLALIEGGQGSREFALLMADYIRSQQDAETGYSFLVAEGGGALEKAPTLRILFLDKIMESDQRVGLEVSREVMDALTNADEYAISLKNLVRYDYSKRHRDEAEERFETLMSQQDWLEEPRAGFYHSFDFAVEFSSRRAFETVASLYQADEEKYGEAFRLSADRIMLRNQREIVKAYLEDTEDFLKSGVQREGYTRSIILSRVDITQPEGLEAFTKYLNSFEVEDEELANFIGFFPNANYFFGKRLVSDQENWAIRRIINKFRETRDAVKNLLDENKIPQEYGNEIIRNIERNVSVSL